MSWRHAKVSDSYILDEEEQSLDKNVNLVERTKQFPDNDKSAGTDSYSTSFNSSDPASLRFEDSSVISNNINNGGRLRSILNKNHIKSTDRKIENNSMENTPSSRISADDNTQSAERELLQIERDDSKSSSSERLKRARENFRKKFKKTFKKGAMNLKDTALAIDKSKLPNKSAEPPSKTKSGDEIIDTIKEVEHEEEDFKTFWDDIKQALIEEQEIITQQSDGSMKKINFFSEDSDEDESSEMRRSGETYETYLKAQFRQKMLFHPEGVLIIIWEMILALLLIYSLINIPYRIGFNYTPSPFLQGIDWLTTSMFAIDVFLNFNKSFVDPSTSQMVLSRKQIAQNYLQFWFWIDIIATIPIDLVVSAFVGIGVKNLKALRIIRIFRLVRLFKLYRVFRVSEIMEDYDINPAYVNIALVFMQMMYLGHFLACFWHFIALPEVSYSFPWNWTTWPGFDLGLTTVTSEYICSVYFICVTMLTIGYGDITPRNELERVYAMIVMFLGVIVFATLVSKVGSIIANRNPVAKAYKERMDEMTSALDDANLPAPIRNRVKVAYSYYLTKKSTFAEEGLLKKLPRPIRKRLILESYKEEFDKVHFFGDVDSTVAAELVLNSHPFQLSPRDVVYHKGDVCIDIVFLKVGVIQASIRETDPIGYISAGNYFGDLELFKKSTSMATYIAINYCEALFISHQVFTDAIGKNFRDAKAFENLVRKRYAEFQHTIERNTRYVALGRSRKSLRATGNTMEGFLNSGKRPTAATPRAVVHKQLNKMFQGNIWNGGGVNGIVWIDGTSIDFGNHRLVAGATILDEGKHWELIRCVEDLSEEDIQKQHIDKGTLIGKQINEEIEYERVVTKSIEDLRKLWLLAHQDPIKEVWDGFITLLILYSVIAAPMEIAFKLEQQSKLTIIGFILDGFFFLDIIVRFHSPHRSAKHDALVLSRSKIAKHYMKSTWFYIDVLSAFPFDALEYVIVNDTSNLKYNALLRLLRLMRLARVLRATRIVSFFETLETSTGIHPAILGVILLVLEILFVSHLFACLWWGLTSVISSDPWFTDYGPDGLFPMKLQGERSSAQYLMSLYYVVTTFSSVGYGDIHPINPSERVVAIVLVMFGGIVFSYLINTISSLNQSFRSSADIVRDELSKVTAYLDEKKCPIVLRAQVLNQYRRQIEDSVAAELERVSDCLPQKLRVEVLSLLAKDKMSIIPFFRFTTNKSVAVRLYKLLTPMACEKDDVLFSKGQHCKEIAFVISGELIATGEKQSIKNTTRLSGSDRKKASESENNHTTRSMGSIAAIKLKFDSLSKRNISLEREALGMESLEGEGGCEEGADKGDSLQQEDPTDSKVVPQLIERLIGEIKATNPNSSDDEAQDIALEKLLERLSIRAKINSSYISINRTETADAEIKHMHNHTEERSRSRRLAGFRSDSTLRPNSLRKGSVVAEMQILDRFWAGDMVGHNGFLKGNTHEVDVLATCSTVLYILNKLELMQLVHDEPIIGNQLKKALTKSISAQKTRKVSMKGLSLEEEMAAMRTHSTR